MIDIKKYLHFGFGLTDFLTLNEFKGRKDIKRYNQTKSLYSRKRGEL
jgi:hypothetical protein